MTRVLLGGCLEVAGGMTSSGVRPSNTEHGGRTASSEESLAGQRSELSTTRFDLCPSMAASHIYDLRAQPKHVQEMYNGLPPPAKKQITKRDKKNP